MIWDNLSAHQRPVLRQLLGDNPCKLLPLPPYSPDFSPIENAFGKLKAYLKAKAARSKTALLDGIAQAISSITPLDIQGWFHLCGYPLAPSV